MSNITVNHKVNVKSSLDWLRDAFYIFRANPIQFICLSLVVMFCSSLSILMSILDQRLSALSGSGNIITIIIAFLSPLFVAQFARLSIITQRGEYVPLASIFKGMFSNTLVIRLGLLNMLVASLASSSGYLSSILPNQDTTISLFFALSLIFSLFMWLAPIICINNSNVTLSQALLLSFKASCSNAITLLVYIFLVACLFILSLLTLGLGLIILMPVLNIVPYLIYKDILITNNIR